MKRLKVGAVNSISFIRNLSYTINSFDVTFEKVVGGSALTLSALSDQLNLDSCSDFIVLNLDLISNQLEGGEYYLTISNEGSSSTYLCEVESYGFDTLGSDIYGDSVVVGDPDLSGLSALEKFNSEQVKIFIANDLESAEALESTIDYGSNIFSDSSVNLSELINGTKKLYAFSRTGGNFIYWAGTMVTNNPDNNPNVPFAAHFPDPHYKQVSLQAQTITEVEAFGSASMFPVLLGMNNAETLLEAYITKLEYVKPGNYNATINATLETAPYAYSRKPAWTNNTDYQASVSGARLALFAMPINDDI